MVDQEQLLELFKEDLLAAGIDPVKHLPGYLSDPRAFIKPGWLFCKYCSHLFKPDNGYKDFLECDRPGHNALHTGNELACEKFKPRFARMMV